MSLNFIRNFFFAMVLLHLASCTTPPIPPEAKQAEDQELILWRSGAHLYLPEEYERYKHSLMKAQNHLLHINTSFFIFRNYIFVQSEFREILKTGDLLKKSLEMKKNELARNIEEEISFVQKQIELLQGISNKMNEGRLARSNLMKAEVILLEVKKRYDKNDLIGADEKMAALTAHLNTAQEVLFPIVKRYSDRAQIKRWEQWFDETVAESEAKNIQVIVVNKIARTLTLYKKGNAVKTYQIGLGRNGSKDKLHAGDFATPEGRYKIIKKLPRSRYHKALLINYPNEDDQRQFELAKKRGLIPNQVGIGGMIELHGGGKESMTYGCIAMDNRDIDELYSIVGVGTPVTIIGAVDSRNNLSSTFQNNKRIND